MKKLLALLLLASPALAGTWRSGGEGLLDVRPGEAAQYAVHGQPPDPISLGEGGHWFTRGPDSPDIVGREFGGVYTLPSGHSFGTSLGVVPFSTRDALGVGDGPVSLPPSASLWVEMSPVLEPFGGGPFGAVGVMGNTTFHPLWVATCPVVIAGFLKPKPESMAYVFAGADVLQVTCVRIGLIPIDVVDGRPCWAWSEERHRDELVDVAGPPVDGDVGIAAWVAGRLQDASHSGPGARGVPANPAEGRHGVVGLESNDGSPKFSLHSTTITQET